MLMGSGRRQKIKVITSLYASRLLQAPLLSVCMYTGGANWRLLDNLSPVHTGDKVARIGNKVECIGNKVDRDKLSNSSCCRFVAGFGNRRLSTKSTVLNSTLSPVCTGLESTGSIRVSAAGHHRRQTCLLQVWNTLFSLVKLV